MILSKTMQLPAKINLFANNKALFLIVFFLIVFSPFFFQKWKLRFTQLYAVSGDEPHYLVIANSIARDGDLEVRNNYENREYGERLKKYKLDHHTYFLDRENKIIPWEEAFDITEGENNSITFTKKEKYRHINFDEQKELSLHPPGYPVILGAIFFPLFRNNMPFIESIIIFSQLLFFYISVLYSMRTFTDKTARVIFLLLSLAYPVWTLCGSFYTEGIIGSLLLLTIAHLERKKVFLFSLDLFFLIFIKELYIPVAFLFIILFFIENGFRIKYISAVILPSISLSIFLLKNYLLFSNPFHTYIPYIYNPNIARTIFELLFSPYKGILIFSPHLIFIPFVFKKYMEIKPWKGIFLILITSVIFALAIFHMSWSGGPSFSYRVVAPILFFTFPLFYLWIKDHKKLRYFCIIVLLVSAANMFYAITNLESSYSSFAFINILEPENSRIIDRFMNIHQ